MVDELGKSFDDVSELDDGSSDDDSACSADTGSSGVPAYNSDLYPFELYDRTSSVQILNFKLCQMDSGSLVLYPSLQKSARDPTQRRRSSEI
jgi:hypothetical protein